MNRMYTDLSIYDFQAKYDNHESCIDALVKLKWPEGYSCRYCKHKNYCATKRYGERRCCSCKKPESATAQTLFHKVKFPLHKAFMMIYLISTTKKGISGSELKRKMGVHKRTALLFKRKVMEAMGSQCNYKMSGNIEVDETYIGGKEVGKPGRSKGSKKLVAIAIQKVGNGVSRVCLRHINNGGVKELKPFFEDHIDKEASVVTDGWRTYKAIGKTYTNLKQTKSNNGKNFDALHRVIMTLKAWLRGIHGSVRDLQPYLDEYMYKFNRHDKGSHIFNLLLKRMVNYPPRNYNQIFSAT